MPAGHSPPRSREPLLEQTSSGPEAETAVEVSSVEEGSPDQALALLLSKREMPDTSRKPRGRCTVLYQNKTLTTGRPAPWAHGTLFLGHLARPETVTSSARGNAPSQPQRFPTAGF